MAETLELKFFTMEFNGKFSSTKIDLGPTIWSMKAEEFCCYELSLTPILIKYKY